MTDQVHQIPLDRMPRPTPELGEPLPVGWRRNNCSAHFMPANTNHPMPVAQRPRAAPDPPRVEL